jgi:hypothetical protein
MYPEEFVLFVQLDVQDDPNNKTNAIPSFIYSVKSACTVPQDFAHTVVCARQLSPRPGMMRILVFDFPGFPEILPCTVPMDVSHKGVAGPYQPRWLEILKANVTTRADEKDKLRSMSNEIMIMYTFVICVSSCRC